MTTPMSPEDVLPDALLERIRGRAAGYDRDNAFFHEDLAELAAAGYLKIFVPASDGGLGLGLFIAKTLLERSGATVTFSNQPSPRSGAVIQIAWPRSAFELPQGTFDWPGARGRRANTV